MTDTVNKQALQFGKTGRGFAIINFTDLYGAVCSIQKSSLATEDAIWFGCDDANPQIMASKTPQGGTGWVPYDIPSDVSLNTRMHLTRDQVRELLPILQAFADKGELPTSTPSTPVQADIQPSGWIPVSERMPDSAQRVLALFPTGYKDVRQTSLVVFVPSKSVKADDLWSDDSGECVEYDEAEDVYYAEQGWYEESYEGETAWKLSCEVTHWMPLPEPPGINSTEDQPEPDNALIGEWSTDTCPRCGAVLLINRRGDKWCSNVGGAGMSACSYGLKSSTEEEETHGL